MDAVKSFNAELSALYEVKPPISKAKMTAITRGAIKAIKFYKHVVQSVEKFILKCKPEYKVPGLYVIDSIVRQSRHQFGADKDVFAPRFSKNMQQTFLNLFKCPPEDKSKIIRVLNLWQKNQVFPPEVVQPLFDLADPNNPIHKELGTPQNQANGLNTTAAIAKGSPALQKTPTKGTQPGNDTAHGGPTLNLTDPNVLAHIQRLLTRSADTAKSESVHFDRKLLDFDYGDEEDEVNPSPKPAPSESVNSLLANPEVLRQLQTLQQSIIGATEMDMDKIRKLQEMKQQEDEFDKHLAQTVPNLPFAAECEFKPQSNSLMGGYFMPPPGQDLSLPPPGYKTQDYELSQQNNGDFNNGNDNGADVEVITLDHDDSRSASPHDDRYSSSRRRRSRSRDRSRDRGRDRDRDKRSRRSRSRSRPRRHRSRSRDRDRNRGKDKEKEKETEKDRERKKRGLPAIKKDNLSVCSTTLWVGHLSKLVHQDDLSNTFGEFGDIVSIDLIPPRGCAFIVMHRRQDAARCLNKLKSHVLHGKAITLAWAPGKGVKGKDLKDYWEGDLGVSYIPWGKLKEDMDLELLEDGGMIDEDTMPQWMKNKLANTSNKTTAPDMTAFLQMADAAKSGAGATVDTSQPPPLPGAGLMQPPMLPLVSPFQFNNRLMAPVGMNVPPGLMPNIPIGVPPPNMPGAMMPNSLLGLNSPFQGMMPPQMSLQNEKNQAAVSVSEANLKSLSETLMSMAAQPFGLVPRPPSAPPHDDNMDVEMEDAEKIEKHIPLSEQLQASMIRNRPNPGGLGSTDVDNRRDRRDDRDRRSSRSRDRDRDHNRDRDRDRGTRGSRDRDRRDRETSRGRDRDRRDDKRERSNRWGDRDRRDHREPEREDRRDREKTLNDRLKEMAGMAFEGGNQNRDRSSRDRKISESSTGPPKFPADGGDPNESDMFRRGGPSDAFERPLRGPPMNDFPPHGPHGMDGPPDMRLDGPPDRIDGPRMMDGPPRLMDVPPRLMDLPPDMMDGPPHMMDGPPHMMDGPPHMMDGPPHMMDGPPHMMDGPPHMMDGPPHMMDGPPHMMDGPPHMMDGPPHMMDGPPHMMDGPPHMMDGPPHMMDGPPHMMDGPNMRKRFPRDDMDPAFMRGGRREFRNDFDPRLRGGPPGPPEFFGPRDGFGPRGPRMRGGPDFGPPNGPPMMRPRFPRGPPMRGPRGPGPWNENRNFGPRFDGPPEFFRGPGGPQGPPGLFEEFPHPRNRGPRFDDRRRGGRDFNPDFYDGPPHDRPPHDHPPNERPPQDRPERRSRWGSSEQFEALDESQEVAPPGAENMNESQTSQRDEKENGNNTPLHDENVQPPGDQSFEAPEPASEPVNEPNESKEEAGGEEKQQADAE